MYTGNSSSHVLPFCKLFECANSFHCVTTVLYHNLPGLSLGLDCLALLCQRSDVNKDLATVAWMIGGFLRLQRYLFLVLWKLLESPHVIQLVAQCPVGWKKSIFIIFVYT